VPRDEEYTPVTRRGRAPRGRGKGERESVRVYCRNTATRQSRRGMRHLSPSSKGQRADTHHILLRYHPVRTNELVFPLMRCFFFSQDYGNVSSEDGSFYSREIIMGGEKKRLSLDLTAEAATK